jgi:hypothetical protein
VLSLNGRNSSGSRCAGVTPQPLAWSTHHAVMRPDSIYRRAILMTS